MNQLEGRLENGVLFTNGGTLHLPTKLSSASVVYFRPEDVEIVDQTSPHVLNGVVAGMSFLGDRTRLLVEGASSKPIVLETGTRMEFHPGDPIRFRVASDRLFAVNDKVPL
jgi:ABC-type Fe3+/spermidine/putrescine transport system ATPase subunit